MDRKERNNIAKSIVNSHNREEVRKIVNSLPGNHVDFSVPSVSANIGNFWLNHNELWEAFSKTKFSKFFYTVDDMPNLESTLEWGKNSEDPKEVQELNLDPKDISTSYIYKRQVITLEDLDDLRDSGEYSEFLDWTTWELRRNVEDCIVSNILGGNAAQGIVNSKYERFVPSEITGTGLEDFITLSDYTVADATDYSYITLDNVQELCDYVEAKSSKWLILTPSAYRILLNDSGLMTEYNLMSNLGVDYIYKTWLAQDGSIICLDPTSYVIKMKNEISVAYPIYKNNQISFQYEINGGGIFKDPQCAALMYRIISD